MPDSPLVAEIVALAGAITSATGLPVRFASSPEGGPGIVLDIPDASWDSYRTGCGEFSSATLETRIWVVAHGHADDQRLRMEQIVWEVWPAVPAPWRVTEINHDRSTADQYVREIRVIQG